MADAHKTIPQSLMPDVICCCLKPVISAGARPLWHSFQHGRNGEKERRAPLLGGVTLTDTTNHAARTNSALVDMMAML